MAVTREDVLGIFGEMVAQVEPSKVKDLNAVIQFDLTGEAGGTYWLKIADGQAQTGEGAAEAARMTLIATAEDFVSMMTRVLNPMQAFMTGKIKIKGDTNLALKLMPLING